MISAALVAATLLLSVPVNSQICNSNSPYECLCSDCWDFLASTETIDWIDVVLRECAPRINETLLRKKLAAWINEECSSVLKCELESPLTTAQIVIGNWQCVNDQREFRVVAVKNISEHLKAENAVRPSIIGQVIQSREHLLSFLLHSELHSVTLHRRFPSTRGSASKLPLIYLIATLSICGVIFGIVVYFANVYINWRRIVQGKWKNKPYKIVSNVRYSTDEYCLVGSPSFTSQS